MAGERIDQILDAYTRCVALYGIEGTTLQHVAVAAGLARGHVRYFVGNGAELRRLFGKRMVARYSDQAAAIAAAGAEGHRAEALVRYFFGDEMAPSDDYAAIDAMFAASRYDAVLRKRMRAAYTGLEALVAAALTEDHPGRRKDLYDAAAYQILALMYGHWTFAGIGFPSARADAALQLALQVIDNVAATPKLRKRS